MTAYSTEDSPLSVATVSSPANRAESPMCSWYDNTVDRTRIRHLRPEE